MGKINLNAMKQARKEQEIETPVPGSSGAGVCQCVGQG